MRWGKIMGYSEMAPHVAGKGWAGNIGFREKDAIWVTPSGGVINDIKMEDIVGITSKGSSIAYWSLRGAKPTSEWEIYWGLFKKRQDANVILHGHDLFALEKAETLKKAYPDIVALTKNVTEAGSPEFRDEILEIATNNNSYLIGREHGFFALGRTFDEAGKLVLEFRSRANRLMIGEEKYLELINKHRIG